MQPFKLPAAHALLAALPALICSCEISQPATEDIEPQFQQTRTVSALVEDAALLLERQGESAAFSKFKKQGSKWFHGDAYVFVFDSKGKSLCAPANPDLEGQNLADLTDADGKQIVEAMLAAVSGDKSAGWVHYQWPKPGDTQPTWKSSYVMQVTDASGRKCIVGSGLYNMKVDQVFLVETVDKAAGWVHYQWPKPGDTKPTWKSSYVMQVTDASGKKCIVGSGLYDMKVDQVFLVETVDKAAELIKKEGRRAFDTLRAKSGPFRYQDVYVYVFDRKGIELVNPVSPELEGKNLLDFKDVNGKPVNQDIIRALETKDRAWMEYMWPRPGETKASKKRSYIRRIKVGGEDLYVGAGAYID